jgi:hypothetical protein
MHNQSVSLYESTRPEINPEQRSKSRQKGRNWAQKHGIELFRPAKKNIVLLARLFMFQPHDGFP